MDTIYANTIIADTEYQFCLKVRSQVVSVMPMLACLSVEYN